MAELGGEPGLLLEIASHALANAGYETRIAAIPEFESPVLVANDPYSTVGVLAPDRLSDAIASLPQQQLSFANWAVQTFGDGNKWDLYLVALSTAEIAQDQLADVETLTGDVRYVRKIVRGAVIPTTESVETALAPFLPVPPVRWQDQAQPLDELERDIRGQGLDPALISTAVGSFRDTGRVSL